MREFSCQVSSSLVDLSGRLSSHHPSVFLSLSTSLCLCLSISPSGKYCDIPLGLYIVRGDNIVLLGQLDDELERAEMKLEMVSPEELANYPDDGNEKLVWDFE
jgi:hypothetical protein